MNSLFTSHPASVNETYFQHMRTALCFCGRFACGAIAALIHAFFPFLFEKTGSALIGELHERMVQQRGRTLDHSRQQAVGGPNE